VIATSWPTAVVLIAAIIGVVVIVVSARQP
jgi:hypothetical protein